MVNLHLPNGVVPVDVIFNDGRLTVTNGQDIWFQLSGLMDHFLHNDEAGIIREARTEKREFTSGLTLENLDPALHPDLTPAKAKKLLIEHWSKWGILPEIVEALIMDLKAITGQSYKVAGNGQSQLDTDLEMVRPYYIDAIQNATFPQNEVARILGIKNAGSSRQRILNVLDELEEAA